MDIVISRKKTDKRVIDNIKIEYKSVKIYYFIPIYVSDAICELQIINLQDENISENLIIDIVCDDEIFEYTIGEINNCKNVEIVMTDTNEKFANSLLKGIKNRECKNNRKKPKTTPMDFLLLKKIKKNLKKSNKSVIDQKVLWTACVLAFWGCFRLGEILPKSKLTFDRFSDLLGADVSVRGGNLSLNLKSTKTRGAEITKVSLSKVHLRGLRPVHAMKSL